MNKLYFMSASEMIKEELDEDKFRYQVSGGTEVVVARDEEWAKKMASKQNGVYPKEEWKVDAVYNLEDLTKLLAEKDHTITKLGSTY